MYTYANDKVRLREPRQADVDNFVVWFNDHEMTANLGQAVRPMSYEQEQQWLEAVLLGRDDMSTFGIEAIDGPQPVHIGGCSLFGIDWRSSNAEVGIFIGPRDYWGKGYGTAAHQLLLEYGFGQLNLHRIWLRVYSFNQRGLRSYQKLGYTYEFTAREAIFRKGAYHDVIYMGMLKREWEAIYANLPE